MTNYEMNATPDKKLRCHSRCEGYSTKCIRNGSHEIIITVVMLQEHIKKQVARVRACNSVHLRQGRIYCQFGNNRLCADCISGS